MALSSEVDTAAVRSLDQVQEPAASGVQPGAGSVLKQRRALAHATL